MSLPPLGNSFCILKTDRYADFRVMEKILIQELEHLQEVYIQPVSIISNTEITQMHKILLNCAESFSEYLETINEPIQFTDNVIPLKREFLKFTSVSNNFQSLFGEI